MAACGEAIRKLGCPPCEANPMLRIFRTKVAAEPPAHFTLRQQRDRAADELVGLCRGVLADGAVSSQEARFLLDWCERNAHLGSDYPFN